MPSVEDKPPGMKSVAISMPTQTCLRILAIAASLAATLLMITSKQSTVVYGIPFEAQYSYSSAFKFFAYANGVASALSILSLVLAIIATGRGCPAADCSFLSVLDLVVTSLVLAGCAAATAIGYVGLRGESHIGWMPICDQVSKFYHRVTLSIATSFMAFLLLKTLAIISVLRS